MIVIVASRHDGPARRLKDQWAGSSACLLTCDDLSVSGWRYRVSEPLNSIAVVEGRQVNQSDIRGVLTRLLWVWEGEVTEIVSKDRAYVACEMSAFLLCWLSSLTCPILNRPTANCLAGPGWSRERWNLAAARAGMRVTPIRRQAILTSAARCQKEELHEAAEISVTVLNGRCLDDVDSALSDQAIRLSEISKTDFLSVRFSGSDADASFVGANIFPDIDDPRIANSALGYFAGCETCS
jgi:hypothetical protein